jgi:hypothetical protein
MIRYELHGIYHLLYPCTTGGCIKPRSLAESNELGIRPQTCGAEPRLGTYAAMGRWFNQCCAKVHNKDRSFPKYGAYRNWVTSLELLHRRVKCVLHRTIYSVPVQPTRSMLDLGPDSRAVMALESMADRTYLAT